MRTSSTDPYGPRVQLCRRTGMEEAVAATNGEVVEVEAEAVPRVNRSCLRRRK